VKNRRTAGVLAALILSASAMRAFGHEHESNPDAAETLGRVVFPTSCTAQVQHRFEGGVALLHSFEYDRATQRFQTVIRDDPGCAIAYWGAAMALYHELWSDPSDSDLADGWQLIQKARLAEKKSPREDGYIQAMAAFYEPADRTVEARTAVYSRAMEKLHLAYPSDDEAAVFYALSLLAAAPPTDTSLEHARKAVRILNEVLARSPEHPGVAHYLIHACDSPMLAQQGLAAARRYANLAPSSPHALHMPSHIFTRLGLWRDDIASNLAAIDAAERGSAGAESRLHPMDFLEYAYLQTGQDDKARAIEVQAVAMKNEGFSHGAEEYYFYVQAKFPALLALETRNWKAAEALIPTAGGEPSFQAMTYWAQSVGAGHLRDVAVAEAAVAKLDEAIAADRKSHPDVPIPPVDTRKNEAHAWLAFAQGNGAAAFELLQPVIQYQDQVGKGEVELPAREMYADMLLELNRPTEALEQYRLSLKSDPNRLNGLYGAGRAAELLQQSDTAMAFYKQLLDNCTQDKSSNRPELAHARQFVAATAVSKNP
jgi:tetratricopeptide (TPR) repeat protein